MNYEKLGFVDGQVLKAVHLNHMESGIKNAVETVLNPNLLDNWYFGKPVNQRGQTSYSGVVYGIDRWLGQNGSLSVQLVSDGIAVTASSAPILKQRLEGNLSQALLGKTATISLLSNNALITKTGAIPDTIPAEEVRVISVYGGKTAVHLSLESVGSMNVTITGTANETITHHAVKLELGSQQTLAHQDADGNWVLNEIPDHREQLFRCQRYFQRFRTESERKTYCEDFRPTMRMTDTGMVGTGTVTEDGVTYYTATADL